MTKSTDEKIAELEILITHQEKQIQDLNDVVVEQGAELAALKKYVALTKSKIQELEHNMSELGSKEISVADEAAANKPPHY